MQADWKFYLLYNILYIKMYSSYCATEYTGFPTRVRLQKEIFHIYPIWFWRFWQWRFLCSVSQFFPISIRNFWINEKIFISYIFFNNLYFLGVYPFHKIILHHLMFQIFFSWTRYLMLKHSLYFTGQALKNIIFYLYGLNSFKQNTKIL